MNKEDILQSHRQESHREYIQFLDSKTVPLILLTFLCLCSVMIILSFSLLIKKIFYTQRELSFLAFLHFIVFHVSITYIVTYISS